MLAVAPAVMAQPAASDVDAAVRLVIVETAVFVEECGKLVPADKAELDAAFAAWPVLKLPVPGVAAALSATSPERMKLAGAIAPYLRRIPSYERDIECSGRYEMLRNPVPMLRGDSANLPPDVLDRYR